MRMLKRQARKSYNFVVICGSTRVGAPGGCKDGLEYVLDELEEQDIQAAAFVYTPGKSVYLSGPSFR